MLSSDRSERLARTRTSLEGLSVGDALGGFFEGATRLPHAVATRTPLPGRWHYTDDIQMALSIVDVLRQADSIDQDQLAQSFVERYDRARGYGPATRAVLVRIGRGGDWRAEAKSIFNGQGSFGNGAATRVAPLGAYFADDLDAVVEHARRAAEVTHAHPEGIAGSIAVAVAAAWAWRLRGSTAGRQEFFDRLLPLIPNGEVASRVRLARELAPAQPVGAAATVLGNGRKVSAQDTVPFALWCSVHCLDNYEEAFWLTASGLGDVDSTCAIVGGVVASHTGVSGIPAASLVAREPLPSWPFDEI